MYPSNNAGVECACYIEHAVCCAVRVVGAPATGRIVVIVAFALSLKQPLRVWSNGQKR